LTKLFFLPLVGIVLKTFYLNLFMQNTLGIAMAQMLKGGVIMDVSNLEQAKIAEEAGAVAVMALERIPSQIRKEGGVARMSNPGLIRQIKKAVSIPVMAKARIGHIIEAQILEALEIDFVDESEVLTPADEKYHIDKTLFKIPFVCGCRNLGEALRRISEGASMIRTKGEAGTGNIVEAVRHQRQISEEIKQVINSDLGILREMSQILRVPFELLKKVKELQELPVVNFAAGGIATPADAALMMSLGSDGVFVGSGIFESSNPIKMAKAIVQAVTFWQDPKKLAKFSEDIGEPMQGLEISTLQIKMAERDQ
jgi:pyridoxal 5'-phosphate synthase pdxS subunit